MDHSIEKLYETLLATGWNAHLSGVHTIGNESCFVVASIFDKSSQIPVLKNLHFAQTSKNLFMVGVVGLGDGKVVNYQKAIEYFERAFKKN